MRKLVSGVLVSVVVGASWLSGCGTDNGDPEVDAGVRTTTPKRDAGSSGAEDDAGSSGDLDSGSSGDNDGGSSGLPDGGSSSGGPVCNDTDDAGGSEAAAKGLPAVSDCDAQVTKSGVANGILDKDFYKFLGTDNFGFGCVVGATAGTTAAELEVCMFVKCKTGDTDFQGCTKGTQATSDIGMKGCCANSPGTVELDYNCTGTTDESGDFYMRVKARVDKCIPYTLSYGL